ncbi:MAG TPA: AtpZ/AtpI family protein [Myxococcaceae bacterium]|nr:AtpZ/AtpI family protein [Myxococcaceae bacterium]
MPPLKTLAVWSLIPSYSLAGGLIGYGLDRWLHTFPLIMTAGLIIGFALAIRDMLRLKKEIFDKKS